MDGDDVDTMTVELEMLRREKRELELENERLRSAAGSMRERVVELADRLGVVRDTQAELAAQSHETEELLRWMKARLLALEREL